MARLIRVDAELVRRGLASSRRHAQELVESELVRLSGETVRKSARQMDPAQPLLVVEGERDEYVSRGARKLAGALDALGEAAPAVAGRRCLDAGASTGGFTDVLLRRGAGHVVAVDVGYGQIAWRLREDPRVTVLERTNVRTLDPAAVAPAPGLVVAGAPIPAHSADALAHVDLGPQVSLDPAVMSRIVATRLSRGEDDRLRTDPLYLRRPDIQGQAPARL